jgi:hypothetical protein
MPRNNYSMSVRVWQVDNGLTTNGCQMLYGLWHYRAHKWTCVCLVNRWLPVRVSSFQCGIRGVMMGFDNAD